MTTVEEKFDQDVWAVLQKIKEWQLYYGKKDDSQVIFTYSTSEWDDPKIIEYLILEKLELWGVIKNRKGDKIFSEFDIVEPKFNEIYSSYKGKVGLGNGGLTEIYYQGSAGIGKISGNNFKLRTEIKRKIFSELYDNMNNEVVRQRILVLMGYYDKNEKPNPAYKSTETYKINETVKRLRQDIGLNTKQLVNNGGNLTLIGKKVEPK